MLLLMYYKLTLKPKDKICELDKKKYIDKLFKDKIEKFTRAVGFADVQDKIIDSVLIKPNVESLKSYIKPNEILYRSLKPSFKEDEVCAFILKKQIVKHNYKKYTYGTLQLLEKFKKFLEKVFPELYVIIDELKDEPKRTLVEFVRDDFYINLGDKYTTVEVSAERLLDENELHTIYQCLSGISNSKYKIYQRYCETCYEYTNGKSPYHIELIFD